MTVIMLEGQGHGDFLSCAQSQRLIIQLAKDLYRPLAAVPASPIRINAPEATSKFTRWRRDSQQPLGLAAATADPPWHGRRAAAPAEVTAAKAEGGGAARGMARLWPLSACSRWWVRLKALRLCDSDRWHNLVKADSLDRQGMGIGDSQPRASS